MVVALRRRAGSLKHLLKHLGGSSKVVAPAPVVDPFPLHGFQDERNPVPLVERLGDEALRELNGLLPWKCFTVDSRGRRFGDRRSPWKNTSARPIPDSRVTLADESFALGDKRVLEVGCFEGGHTIALCRVAKEVLAVDARVVNVVKTIVRCGFYETNPKVMLCDLETWDPGEFDVDVVFHVGVLYHLRDPVRHVMELGRMCRSGLLLDTHVAEEAQASETFVSEGGTYRYQRYEEMPRLVAAGMYDHAKWLLLDDLIGLLHRAGFSTVEVKESRKEGTSTRVTVLAHKANGRP